MKFARQANIFKGQLDVAPVASIAFLLVLFLLLNSALVFPPGVRITLPVASDLPGASGPSVTVAMDASGQLFFENQIILEQNLKERLAQAARDSADPLILVVQLDRSLRVEELVRLSVLAREAGMQHVVLATRPPITVPKRNLAPIQ